MTMLTVSVDTEQDAYEDVVALLNRIYDLDPAVVSVDMPEGTIPAAGDDGKGGTSFNGTVWTPAKMRRYVAHLTDGGRVALRSMVANGPHTDMDTVQADTGLTAAQFAGMMSTFGHARNGTRGVYGLPFIRTARSYFLPNAVSDLADDALSEVGV